MTSNKNIPFLIYTAFCVLCLTSPIGTFATSQPLKTQSTERELLSARGVIEAVDRATISSGLSSKIIALGFRRGQNFKKGDVLVEFSCNTERARRDAAKASYTAARQSHEKNKELLSFEATGRFDVEISEAEMAQALATYNEQRAILSMCNITAPYNGSIVGTFINAHETPQASQPLIEIVNTEQMEITLIVPSSSLLWLREKDEFQFDVEDTGTITSAYIDRIGAVVDPVSQTVEVIAIINNPSTDLRPGMGGVGKFKMRAGG